MYCMSLRPHHCISWLLLAYVKGPKMVVCGATLSGAVNDNKSCALSPYAHPRKLGDDASLATQPGLICILETAAL